MFYSHGQILCRYLHVQLLPTPNANVSVCKTSENFHDPFIQARQCYGASFHILFFSFVLLHRPHYGEVCEKHLLDGLVSEKRYLLVFPIKFVCISLLGVLQLLILREPVEGVQHCLAFIHLFVAKAQKSFVIACPSPTHAMGLGSWTSV